jgi:chromosome segregation protein
MSDRTQFVLVTHNRATMEMADALYGVTMSTAAVSQVVAVRLPL